MCVHVHTSHTGLRVLREGGNAADAAVAVAAALNVTEPCSTGMNVYYRRYAYITHCLHHTLPTSHTTLLLLSAMHTLYTPL